MLKKKRSKIKTLLNLLILSLCLLVVGLVAMPFIILNPMINTHMNVKVYSAEDYGVMAKPLTLETEDGLSVASWITETKEAKGIVILLSGIQSPSVTAFWGYAKMLEDNGYASLLIEMRGHGDSDGDRVSVGMEEWLDVQSGVEYIKSMEEYRSIPIIIWGTSMGAATAINSIGRIPEIDGAISFSAYSTFADVFCDYLPKMGMPTFVAPLIKPFVNLYLGLQYGFDKLSISPINEIQNLEGRPMLLAHSTEDSQVAYASFERLKAKAVDTVDTFTRDGDEHFIFYSQYLKMPVEDTEISEAVLQFLKDNFE